MRFIFRAFAQALQALNLEGNLVGALPVSLCELRGLISLNLRDNKIASVGDEIAKLPPGLKVRILMHIAADTRSGAVSRQEQDPKHPKLYQRAHFLDASGP